MNAFGSDSGAALRARAPNGRAIPTTVLMYHALAQAGAAGIEADPQYAVSEPAFLQQLHLIEASGAAVCSVADCLRANDAAPRVALTFDDGHVTNQRAAELLAGRRGTADFFVNPSTVGQLHYLSWQALRDMAHAGMSIQSHSYNHVYLDDLTTEQVRDQLLRSKAEIEDHLGQPVTLFAPPGGRQPPNMLALAEQAGYQRVCSSRAGLWRRDQAGDVPRFAVLGTTGSEQFQRWLAQDGAELRRQERRYRWLGAAKRILGNRRYERWRAALLSGAGGTRP